MGTKLERIAEISATSPKPEFTALYHHINAEMLMQCHKELDGSKAVGVDKVTKDEYSKSLEDNITSLVLKLKAKAYKPLPSLRVFIPKVNGKMHPLGIAAYEDKIVQLAVKKILEAIYEPRFLNCMFGFRPGKSCHDAIKVVHKKLGEGKINYIVDADIKGFFDNISHEWMMRFLANCEMWRHAEERKMKQHMIDVRKTYTDLKMTSIHQFVDGDTVIVPEYKTFFRSNFTKIRSYITPTLISKTSPPRYNGVRQTK